MPTDITCAYLAETILLARERRLASFTLDESLNPDKLEEIADIATRHNFEVWQPEAPIL